MLSGLSWTKSPWSGTYLRCPTPDAQTIRFALNVIPISRWTHVSAATIGEAFMLDNLNTALSALGALAALAQLALEVHRARKKESTTEEEG